MNQVRPKKPSPEVLKAYALGKLQGPERIAVEQYLELCDTACNELNLTQGDTLLEQLREIGEQREIPGSKADDEEHEIPEELLNHPKYEIRGILGEGGMGVVYKALHRVMDREVALKTISQRVVRDKASLARFTREVKAAASLQHPNIVTAHDAEQAGKLHFLVTELVEGRSLDRVIQEEGPMSVKRASGCIQQAAMGLQHAHQRDMVHRDIKPHNLMLTPEGQVKILDFGLARLRDADAVGAITKSDVVIGTPDFMSPEQAEDSSSVDFPSDIYSLDCTMYYLLTGSPPFPQPSLLAKLSGHFEGTPEPISSFRSDVPQELERFLMHGMMAKNPANRPKASDVTAALVRYSGKPVSARATPVTVPPQSRISSPSPIMATPVVSASNAPNVGAFPTAIESAADRLKPRRNKGGINSYAWPIGISAVALAAIVLAAIMLPEDESKPQANSLERERPRAQAQRSLSRPGFGDVGDAGNGAFPLGGGQSEYPSDDDPFTELPSKPIWQGKVPRVLIAVTEKDIYGPDYWPVVNTLRASGAKVVIASPSGETARFHKSLDELEADVAFHDQTADDYDAVVFISGDISPYTEDGCCVQNTKKIVWDMLDAGKLVASICTANDILAEQGFAHQHESDDEIQQMPKNNGIVLTGRDARVAQEFSQELVKTMQQLQQKR